MRPLLVVITLMLVYGSACAKPPDRKPEKLSDEDQAVALKAAQSLFGTRHPNLELVESGRIFKGGRYAHFAYPAARISDRMRTYTLILCHTQQENWNCVLGYTHARFVANGIEHSISLGDLPTNSILPLVDFIFSSCFGDQLSKTDKPFNSLRPKKIQSIHKRGDNFVVQGEWPVAYEIRKLETANECKFNMVATHRVFR